MSRCHVVSRRVTMCPGISSPFRVEKRRGRVEILGEAPGLVVVSKAANVRTEPVMNG